jgi:elongation factor Ts
MVVVTAAMVKELRETTGLGMMECKKALEEAGGDPAKAEDLLRVRSGAKASKAAGRIAAEGAVGMFVSEDGKLAAMVEVNSETDFVAKNEDFLRFVSALAELVAKENPSDLSALSALGLGAESVEEKRRALVQKIGENMTIRRFHRAQASDPAARIGHYLHGVKIGVLVEIEGGPDVGKDIAMHIAFAKPRYMSEGDLPDELISREREVLAARARESGKPPEIASKMVEGGLAKFISEITLLGQPFVKDEKGQSVEKALAARKGKVLSYAFFVVGEGLEKRSDDFAADVMAQAKSAGQK